MATEIQVILENGENVSAIQNGDHVRIVDNDTKEILAIYNGKLPDSSNPNFNLVCFKDRLEKEISWYNFK